MLYGKEEPYEMDDVDDCCCRWLWYGSADRVELDRPLLFEASRRVQSRNGAASAPTFETEGRR